MTDLGNYKSNVFEKLLKTNEYGSEFWFGRELAEALEYTQWRNFINVINKAKDACKHSNINTSDHFADISKMIALPKGAEREIDDIMLPDMPAI